jgi:hypothetical protein
VIPERSSSTTNHEQDASEKGWIRSLYSQRYVSPSSFASSWKLAATAVHGGIGSVELSMPPPANAGDTITLRPRWDENLPGIFHKTLFRDDEAIRNPGRT